MPFALCWLETGGEGEWLQPAALGVSAGVQACTRPPYGNGDADHMVRNVLAAGGRVDRKSRLLLHGKRKSFLMASWRKDCRVCGVKNKVKQPVGSGDLSCRRLGEAPTAASAVLSWVRTACLLCSSKQGTIFQTVLLILCQNIYYQTAFICFT